MVARWIANLILLLMLIGLAMGIRYELMVTEIPSPGTGDTVANPRRVELEPSPADSDPAPSPASPAAPRPVAVTPPGPPPMPGTPPPNRSPERLDSPAVGPTPESVETPPVVRLSPDGGQPNTGQDQDHVAADGVPVGRSGTRPTKVPPVGFGVDPFAPDEGQAPQAVGPKAGGAPARRGH